MNRAYTKEEVREQLIDYIHGLVDYWSNIPKDTVKEQLSGLAFSMLVIFDGDTINLPAMNISLSPHPEDKQWYIDRGENWYEPDMIINDNCSLHDLFCKRR